MRYHLTQEQALEIASDLEIDGCDITVWENGYVEFENKTALQSFANAVLDRVLGEPVAYRWYESKFDDYRYAENPLKDRACEVLYAPKEQS